jgi:hypothetical protein
MDGEQRLHYSFVRMIGDLSTRRGGGRSRGAVFRMARLYRMSAFGTLFAHAGCTQNVGHGETASPPNNPITMLQQPLLPAIRRPTQAKMVHCHETGITNARLFPAGRQEPYRTWHINVIGPHSI